MKKFVIFLVVCVLLASVLSSCTLFRADTDETTAETKPSVTTARDGFEDVTDPPIETTAKAEDKAETTDAQTEPEEFTTEDAVAAAKAYLGEKDPDTGYKYTFSFEEMMTVDGAEVFKIRVSWFIEEQGRSSYCGDLLVSKDGKTVSKYNW